MSESKSINLEESYCEYFDLSYRCDVTLPSIATFYKSGDTRSLAKRNALVELKKRLRRVAEELNAELAGMGPGR